jgi:hypothetical protein
VRPSALLIGPRLFDRPELQLGSLSLCLIILEEVFAAVRSFSHKTHRFLGKLIATERYIISMAERLRFGFDGASCERQADCGYGKSEAHGVSSSRR